MHGIVASASPSADYKHILPSYQIGLGWVRCHISIVDNDINSDKSFSVKAVVVSPGSAKFGSLVQNNTGSIEIIKMMMGSLL